jgi:hypothetical protein
MLRTYHENVVINVSFSIYFLYFTKCHQNVIINVSLSCYDFFIIVPRFYVLGEYLHSHFNFFWKNSSFFIYFLTLYIRRKQ